MLAWVAFSLAIACAGCFMNNLKPKRRLHDAVFAMNDAARWGRLDLAVTHVSPAYRQRFLETHEHWEEALEVADMELTHLEMAPDGKTAVSKVAFRWYRLRQMELKETVVEQRWTLETSPLVMIEEKVSSGNADLLQKPSTD